MMKVISVVGARPQFVKLAAISKHIRSFFEEVIIHTGQHYDYELSKSFFNELNIPEPDYNLGVGSASHGIQTGKMMIELETIFLDEKPNLVIVFGDTNSTLAGALVASKLNIKLAHVEAGMRNYDRRKAEEINRVITDHVSDYLFTPTKSAVENLLSEGITDDVYNVGDLHYDIILENIDSFDEKSNILKLNNIAKKKYVLLTIHKPKNTDNKKRLVGILNCILSTNEQFVFPVHPRTKKALMEYGLWYDLINSKIMTIEPLGFHDFMMLLKNATKVITDSGSVQKEAYMLKIPCITLRETEWVETVIDGWNIVVNDDKDKLVDSIQNFQPQEDQSFIFGSGQTGKQISEILFNLLKVQN